MTAIFTHPDCLRHDPGVGHPETPDRLRAILARARQAGFEVREVPAAALDPILAVHPAPYIESVRSLAQRGGGALFLDTIINGASFDAALGAVGALLAGIQHAHAGRGHAFAAVRPPGHHALAAKGMGFCLFSNAVVGARWAQRHGSRRILIVDWDVHHGNGTQALVEDDPTIRYVSLHQWPWYPGTGAADERGVGNVFNVPRGPGLPPQAYVEDLWAAILAATTNWTPDLILLSAGYDGMSGDPLGGFTLEPEHYATWTTRLRDRLPEAPIVGLLEGGYVPARLADGVIATVRALG